MSLKKTFKKVVPITLATVSVCASMFAMTSCTTAKPEVTITLSFNGETYELDYTLYRNIAPATVQHFLELADAGYYNGLCIHDYQQTRWVTGGYTYSNGSLVEKDYFEAVRGLELTQTVWYDAERTDPAYTVYGEFESNGFDVQNGDLREQFGCLTMYYTAKGDVDRKVTVKRNDGDGYVKKDYAANSATSLFYIHVSSTGSDIQNYCTFALLSDEGKAKLSELQSDITEFIESTYGADGTSEDFAPSKEVTVNTDDRYAEESEVDYSVPETPIIVQSVKVTKW